ncbi:hypothetical protein K1719_025673 [Acacia pycnantha]|nr:hypothetical protein K1719_025673 [Acacia pycnantha]
MDSFNIQQSCIEANFPFGDRQTFLQRLGNSPAHDFPGVLLFSVIHDLVSSECGCSLKDRIVRHGPRKEKLSLECVGSAVNWLHYSIGVAMHIFNSNSLVIILILSPKLEKGEYDAGLLCAL